MDYLRQIEDELVSLGNETKRKYPEVKDATDRALATLKTIRGSLKQYITMPQAHIKNIYIM